MGREKRLWAMLRILLGLVFLWAFLDKFFGLGRWLTLGTPVEKSVLSGASVTQAISAAATDRSRGCSSPSQDSAW